MFWISHNPIEKSESRTVYFLGSFGGGGAGHGLYEVKMEGGRVVGKSGYHVKWCNIDIIGYAV